MKFTDGRMRALAGLLVFLTAGAARLTAQGYLLGAMNPLGGTRNGLQLYDVTAFADWQSMAGPETGFSIPLGTGLKSDVSYGGGATVGWARLGGRSNFSLTYSANYMARWRYSDWNALNHFLRMVASRRLNSKWTLGFAGTGILSNYEQLLFSPTVFSSMTSVPATFDDLAAAAAGGKLSNSELASLLTGAPVIQSPSQTLLFGNRTLLSSAGVTLAYNYSPRLSISFDAIGSRIQHLPEPQNMDAPKYVYLLPSATMAGSTLSVSYAITPRTEIGVTAVGSRGFSRFANSYSTYGTAFVGRSIGRRWFARLRGGAGEVIPINGRYAAAHMTSPVAGATLGFKTYTQTFMADYSRIVGDTFGIGAARSSIGNAAWTLHQPGRHWSLHAYYLYQQLSGSAFHGFNGWRASAGISRMLGLRTMLETDYSYGQYAGAFTGTNYKSDQHAVRVSFSWMPQPPEL